MYDEFLNQIQKFIFVEDKLEKADIIFVPGNGYPDMAENAARLYKNGFAPIILPSGKHSVVNGKFAGVLKKENIYTGDYQTEWDFLKDVLVKNGVALEDILKENNATYTYENALFCKEILQTAGITIKKAIICCKTHHSRRCLMYFQKVFPEVEFMVAPSDVDGITKETWTDTKEGIEAVLGEAQRLVVQFSVLMK